MSTAIEHRPAGTTDVEHRSAAPQQQFTREQVELIKRTVAQGTSDDELGLFLETAKRRNLDPFSGQIHAIMRWDGRANREVMKIQTGIDGFRSMADRTALVEYVEGPEWSADGETWRRVWLDSEPPAVARFTVKRRDRSRPETRVAHWREYRQTKRDGSLTRSWGEMGAGMLGKCAEALALRAALPEQLGGVYTVEEMDQAHHPEAGDAAAPASPAATAEVDNPKRRRELFDRFRPWYDALDEDARGEVWNEIRGRLYGEGGLGARFAATPLHVLEEIVDAHVPADVDDTPDDEPGEQQPVDGEQADDDVVDAEVVDEDPDDATTGDPCDVCGTVGCTVDHQPPADDERDAANRAAVAAYGERLREKADARGYDWRAHAAAAGVKPLDVLMPIQKGWPNNDLDRYPKNHGALDELVASDPVVADEVRVLIDDIATKQKEADGA